MGISPVNIYGSTVINALEGIDYIHKHALSEQWVGGLQLFFGNITDEILIR